MWLQSRPEPSFSATWRRSANWFSVVWRSLLTRKIESVHQPPCRGAGCTMTFDQCFPGSIGRIRESARKGKELEPTASVVAADFLLRSTHRAEGLNELITCWSTGKSTHPFWLSWYSLFPERSARKSLIQMVGGRGLEPRTSCL
jgi:hypothetical protein